MSRMNFVQGQEIIRQDMNSMSAHMQREFYDRVVAELLGNTSNGFFGAGFLVTYVDGTHVSVAAGNGFQTDNTQVSPEPKKRPLYLASAASKTLTTPHATNPRIDIVCVKAQLVDSLTESRRYKASIATLPTLQDFVTEKDWDADVIIVAGTAAGSPVAPATPSGYIKISTLTVAAVTGLAGSGSVTDERVILSAQDNTQIDTSAFLAVTTKAAGTKLKQVLAELDLISGAAVQAYDAVVGSVSGCTHSTLALALAAASPGWRILVVSNATINTTITCAVASVEIQLKNGVTYSKGSATTGLVINAADCTVRGGKFTGFSGGSDKAISVSAGGTRSMFRDIRFATNTTDIDDANDLADILGCV